MIKNYTLEDGGKFSAASASDFVEQMRSSSRFDESQSNDEYRLVFAERYKVATGYVIDCSSDEAFVGSLIATGYITE